MTRQISLAFDTASIASEATASVSVSMSIFPPTSTGNSQFSPAISTPGWGRRTTAMSAPPCRPAELDERAPEVVELRIDHRRDVESEAPKRLGEAPPASFAGLGSAGTLA